MRGAGFTSNGSFRICNILDGFRAGRLKSRRQNLLYGVVIAAVNMYNNLTEIKH